MPSRVARILALVAALLAAWPARSVEIASGVDLSAFARVRASVYEQMEEVSGLTQKPSLDDATGTTTGFALDQARARLAADLFEKRLGLVLEMRLERGPALLDAYGEWRFAPWLALRLGQFRIPSAWENLVADRRLDFILRPEITNDLADLSLSRTTYPSSVFYGNKSWRRDTGLGIAGDVDLGVGTLRYLGMISNGLGANLFVGGGSDKEFLLTNGAQFFYGARVDVLDLFGFARVGGHVCWNEHDNVVFNSGRMVYDLDRFSWSVDAGVEIPGTGLRAQGLYGAGQIDDDFDADGRRDLDYYGAEARLVWRLDLLLRALGTGWTGERHHLDLGGRYDTVHLVANEAPGATRKQTVTVGATYAYGDLAAVRVNWIQRWLEDEVDPDLDDDALLLDVTVGF